MVRGNQRVFDWTPKRQLAAQLLAEDDLADTEIAKKAGIAVATLYIWKLRPEFAAKIAEIRATLGDMSLRYLIAQRRRRVRALDERWHKMQAVLDERGDDPLMRDVPGGKSGLLVVQYKALHLEDDEIEVVAEYKFDAALVRELREHEKQAAQELGQWVEKVAPTSPDGQQPATTHVNLTVTGRIDELTAAFAAVADRASQGGPSGDGAGKPLGS